MHCTVSALVVHFYLFYFISQIKLNRTSSVLVDVADLVLS